MKIKSYQSGGGITYLPTVNRMKEAEVAEEKVTSKSSDKRPKFAEELFKMADGIDVDVAKLIEEANVVLDLANDPNGDNITMRDFLKLTHRAAIVKNNKKDYDDTRKALDSEEAWGEVAITNQGKIYVFNNETSDIETVTIKDYSKNKELYIALTNGDLMNQRRMNPNLAFNNAILDDLSKAVGTKTIVEYINGLISKFGDTEVSGYVSKQNQEIKAGLNEIVNGILSGGNSIVGVIQAGEDGIYKITQKSTHADTHLKEALNYLITALPSDYKRALSAKAAMEEFDPQAMLLEMLIANTGRTIKADLDVTANKSSNGKGSSKSSSEDKSLIQAELAEAYATGEGLNPGKYVEITPYDSTTSLVAYTQNAGPVLKDNNGKKGNPMPVTNVAQLLEESYGIRNITSNTVVFGDQLIDNSQIGGLVYDKSDMHRVVLPAKVEAGGRHIVPDFELQNKLDDIIKNAKEKGADASIINRYLAQECPGATYDEVSGTIKLPKDRVHVFLTFGATAASNYIDFDENSNYLVPSNMDVNVYKESVKFGSANHSKNAEVRLEGTATDKTWFTRTSKHLYQGNVFMPITSELAGSAIYNQEYRPKSSHTNITGRAIERERRTAVKERLSDSNNLNW